MIVRYLDPYRVTGIYKTCLLRVPCSDFNVVRKVMNKGRIIEFQGSAWRLRFRGLADFFGVQCFVCACYFLG